MRSNQIRLYCSSIAYCLIQALRRLGLAGTEMAKAPCQTIRLRLLKIGVQVRLGRWFIDGGMRKGTPSEDHENVITVYGGTDLWKQRLGFQSPDAAYPMLLDHRGVVGWRHSGMFDEEAYRGLSIHVAALLRGRQ